MHTIPTTNQLNERTANIPKQFYFPHQGVSFTNIKFTNHKNFWNIYTKVLLNIREVYVIQLYCRFHLNYVRTNYRQAAIDIDDEDNHREAAHSTASSCTVPSWDFRVPHHQRLGPLCHIESNFHAAFAVVGTHERFYKKRQTVIQNYACTIIPCILDHFDLWL